MNRPRRFPFRLLLAWAIMELVAAAQVRTSHGTLLWEWARAITAPPLEMAARTFRAAGDLTSGLADVARLAEEHRRLRVELERARVREHLLSKELTLLRRSLPLGVLGLRLHRGAVVTVCRYRRLPAGPLEIAGGARDGLVPDAPVLAEAGVVGRVWRAGSATSWVEPITAPTAAVSVTVADGAVRGLAQGRGDGSLDVLYLPHAMVLVVGDELSTSGDEGIYPPGLPVARVVRVRETGGPFLSVLAEPLVDLTTVRMVVVLPGWHGGARRPG